MLQIDHIKSFAIQPRQHSPNAVVGITNDGARVFITAPASSLGKQVGDQLALVIRDALDKAYINRFSSIEPITPNLVECPHCKELQTHSYPMSGKLYCRSCGELIDDIHGEPVK